MGGRHFINATLVDSFKCNHNSFPSFNISRAGMLKLKLVKANRTREEHVYFF